VTESTTSAVDTDPHAKTDNDTDTETETDTTTDTDTLSESGTQTGSETVSEAETQVDTGTDREGSDGSPPAEDLETEQQEVAGQAARPAVEPESSGNGDSDAPDESGDGDGMDRLENEGEIAADYLEELLDIADLDGDLDMDVEGDRAAVSIVGGDVRQLVGRNGEVLEALQELTRLAVYRETGERSRLMLDVGGFRADRRSRLEKVAAEAVEEVRSSGQPKALEAMTPFERKVVHDVVAAAGLSSASEGEEPRRYVVVLPA